MTPRWSPTGRVRLFDSNATSSIHLRWFGAPITEPNELRSWFPCDVEISGGRWEAGAAITFRFSPKVMDMTLSGRVVIVEEPTLLVHVG